MTLDFKSKQSQFLSTCATSGKTLSEVLEEIKLEPTTLARWLVQRSFRQRVNRLRKSLAMSRELTLAIGAVRAAQVLSGATQMPTNCNQRACIELIRLARDVKARRRAEERPSKRSLTPTINGLPVHPDLDPDEAQTLINDLK